ncbi:hypothetical protein H072_6936 [Dactylellina haptotyla CBS 200.50]|uniref:Uncharacterized protein n=1 Tax=Dactylellina haptotyla (strain CBS 200.50) TaxID=1284197 RepID=S8ADW1_DACHA|nr:hypothetical protein H072_6936 [Dactylellina haptotyla CBS 200.50]
MSILSADSQVQSNQTSMENIEILEAPKHGASSLDDSTESELDAPIFLSTTLEARPESTSIFSEYKSTMDYILRFMPGAKQPAAPQRPELRDLSGLSRLLDMNVKIDSGNTSTFTSRLITGAPIRKWWRDAIARFGPRNGVDNPGVRPNQIHCGHGSMHATLFDLPNEMITNILDQSLLTDIDRIRFGSACALLMRNAIPVLYKYALVRYPIKNRDMYHNLKMVAHLVQEMIIHMPADQEPVLEERDYIPPYEILNKMTGLKSVTIYFDAKISPHEVTCLLRYLLKSKERLTRITLDIIELRSPLAAYEPRTIYDVDKALGELTPPGSTLPGAQLQNLSICIKSSFSVISAEGLRQLFTGHCNRLESLRMVPQIRHSEALDLSMFRSPRMSRIHWIAREGTPNIFDPPLQAVTTPDTVHFIKIHALLSPRFLLVSLLLLVDRYLSMKNGFNTDVQDNLYPAPPFPFPQLQFLDITMYQLAGQTQAFSSDDSLRVELKSVAAAIFRDVPSLHGINVVEERHGMFFEMAFRRGTAGGTPVFSSQIY